MSFQKEKFLWIAVAILLAAPAVAAAQQNDLHSATGANSGGKATSASYTLYATIGQTTSGIGADATNELKAGLLSRMLLAPSFSIGVLASSVVGSYLSVYAVSSRTLDADASGEFTLGGGSPTAKTMAILPSHDSVYQTTYMLNGGGNLTITVSGRVAGIVGETTRLYAIAAATPSAPFFVMSPDGMTQVTGLAGAVRSDGFILVSTLTEDIPPFFRELKGLGDTAEFASMQLVGNVLEIVSTAVFDGGVKLMLGIEPQTLETLESEPYFDERKVGVYRLSDGKWSFVGGYGKNGAVEAEVRQEGVYGAIYNPHQTLLPEIEIPDGLELYANFPNPFNPTTTIRFGLPEEGIVRLLVYDVRGRLVKELVNGLRPAGHNDVIWDGTNTEGESVGTGVYFARLESKETTRTRKMLLLK